MNEILAITDWGYCIRGKISLERSREIQRAYTEYRQEYLDFLY